MSAPGTTVGGAGAGTPGRGPSGASLWLLTSTMTRAAQGRLRLALSVAAALALGGIGLAVRAGADDAVGVPDELVATLVATLVLTLYAPLISLVQAASVVGDLRDDGTLVYLWLRPVARWRLALAAAVAVFVRSAPLAVLAAVVLALAAGGSTDLVVASGYAALLGCVGYAGLFSFLGLAVRRALVWGLVYVLVWEGVVGTFGALPARLAVSSYSTALLAHLGGTPAPAQGVGLAWAWAGPVLIALVALVASHRRLVRGEVA
ncbi:ABC transporter permease [Aquipuribacter hungaricus]|uniref:ABC transporter permease n=1 Tax=Aquipuribacter hungaricus TaxID=545624 RepID=A0ABV7WLL3_9MICO